MRTAVYRLTVSRRRSPGDDAGRAAASAGVVNTRRTCMAQVRLPSSGNTASGNTDWTWRRETPLSRFLSTESGSAVVLLAATVVALVWANVATASYQAVWHTTLSVQLGGSGLTMDLVGWVNFANGAGWYCPSPPGSLA